MTLVYCGQTVGWIKMKLGTEVGLGPGDIMLDGDPTPPPLKGHSSQFSANVHCGQTAGWTKLPLSMKVGLGPCDFVFDGNPAPPEKMALPHPIFGLCLLWPNGWVDQDATWYGGRPQPRPHCARWDPAPLHKKGVQLPNYRPVTIVAKRLDGSRCHLAQR